VTPITSGTVTHVTKSQVIEVTHEWVTTVTECGPGLGHDPLI
jgi:hypothetical protein